MTKFEKREDPMKIAQILALRASMFKAGFKWNESLFAQVKSIPATRAEHEQGTFPDTQPIIREKKWKELVRYYNVWGDEKKLVIGVDRTFKKGGRIIHHSIVEMAYHDTAPKSREHQDTINDGGKDKSRKLLEIEKDSTLKRVHDKELDELKQKLRRSKRRI